MHKRMLIIKTGREKQFVEILEPPIKKDFFDLEILIASSTDRVTVMFGMLFFKVLETTIFCLSGNGFPIDSNVFRPIITE